MQTMQICCSSIENCAQKISALNMKRNFLNDLIANLRNIFYILTISQLFIGLSGFFETYIVYSFLDHIPHLEICCVVFMLAFGTYTLDRLTESKEDTINMPVRRQFLFNYRKFFFCSALIAYVISITIVLMVDPKMIFILLVPLIANVIYGSRIFPGLPRLKDIPVMKNTVVAVSWTLVTTLLPMISISHGFDGKMIAIFYFMLVKSFINSVLYDMRDIDGDKESGVRTIPVILGIRKSSSILFVLNCTILLGLFYLDGMARLLSIMLTIYGYVYIAYIGRIQDPLTLDFFVEGEWMHAVTFLIILNFIQWLRFE
jgi:4-hydroxybenzoate polyprenyltransferase